MKKNLIFILILSILSGCNDYKAEYVKPLAAGGKVDNILVSPSTATIYVDSDMPVLKYVCIPHNAIDTTVKWISSNPDIIKVDSLSGILSWGKPANAKVFISAISNNDKAKYGKIEITVKNIINKYHYIDLRKEIGLWILDRNIGASTPEKAGDYYHFGYNVPVANKETGGPMGEGDYYYYTNPPQNSWRIPGGLPEFDWQWKPDPNNKRYSDWEHNDNQGPCPQGWRIPTIQECEEMAYKSNPDNYKTILDKSKAKNLFKKLNFGLHGIMSLTGGNWEIGKGYVWTNHVDLSEQKVYLLRVIGSKLSVVGVKYNGNFSRDDEFRGAAVPIRCVRSNKTKTN